MTRKQRNKSAILYLVYKNPLVHSATEFAIALGVSRQTVHTYLNELEREMLISREKGKIGIGIDAFINPSANIMINVGVLEVEKMQARVKKMAMVWGLLS